MSDEPTPAEGGAAAPAAGGGDFAHLASVGDVLFECRGIHHWFGSHHVLHDVNLKIGRGQIVGLVGPSGCGKSTLLRAIVGTHPPRQGQVIVEGQVVTRPGRDRGIVYQQYSLFPFLTAVQNVAFGLMLDQTTFSDRWLPQRIPAWRRLRKQHLDEAAALLEKIDLGHAINRYPHMLSGGMRQRVAIAQALIMKPELLLLDEPFGALDEATREELQDMLLDLYQENLQAKEQGQPPPHTILIVTHELNEALYVSDRVVGLSQYWRWEDAGLQSPPGATIVYDAPAPIFQPRQPRELTQLVEQRHEIRGAVFEPGDDRPQRGAFLRFWRPEQYQA